MTTIQAISLPDEERAVIAAEFAHAGEDFEQWQRDVLAAKLEALRTQRAQAQAQELVAAAQAELRGQMPTLFDEPGGQT